MGQPDSRPSPDLRVDKERLSKALLEVPNDPRLIELILHGDPKNPEGRSGALYKLSARLGESGVRPEAAKAILMFADKEWGKFSTREDGEQRIENLMGRFFQSKPKSDYVTLVPLSVSQLKDATPEVDWLIENMMAKHTYGVITGGTGVGKSQLAMQLGYSLAKGVKWNNYELVKSRVLYGSHEMMPNELIGFTEPLNLGMRLNEDEDIFHIIPSGRTISLITTSGREFYNQFLDDYDVFFFDTASASTHLGMLDEATGLGLVEYFQFLKSEGKTVFVLGHDTKEAVRSSRSIAEDAYGYRLLGDQASMMLRVEKWDEEHVVLSFPKLRMAKEPKPVVYARDETTLWLTSTVEDPFKRPSGGKVITMSPDQADQYAEKTLGVKVKKSGTPQDSDRTF